MSLSSIRINCTPYCYDLCTLVQFMCENYCLTVHLLYMCERCNMRSIMKDSPGWWQTFKKRTSQQSVIQICSTVNENSIKKKSRTIPIMLK